MQHLYCARCYNLKGAKYRKTSLWSGACYVNSYHYEIEYLQCCNDTMQMIWIYKCILAYHTSVHYYLKYYMYLDIMETYGKIMNIVCTLEILQFY